MTYISDFLRYTYTPEFMWGMAFQSGILFIIVGLLSAIDRDFKKLSIPKPAATMEKAMRDIKKGVLENGMMGEYCHNQQQGGSQPAPFNNPQIYFDETIQRWRNRSGGFVRKPQ